METRTSRYPSLRSRVLSRRFRRAAAAVTRSRRLRSRVGLGNGPAFRRPPFLNANTQQVRTARGIFEEIGRAVLALGGLAAWAAVALLIAA
jgi:hypothetical protein